MKETMERFSVLPFSIGCVSHSSVDVRETQLKKPQRESSPSTPSGEAEEKSSSKSNISAKLQKLMKSLKSLPYTMFQAYIEEEDDEIEMEIGIPTDVLHVGHVGLDGSNYNSLLSSRKFELVAAREDINASV